MSRFPEETYTGEELRGCPACGQIVDGPRHEHVMLRGDMRVLLVQEPMSASVRYEKVFVDTVPLHVLQVLQQYPQAAQDFVETSRRLQSQPSRGAPLRLAMAVEVCKDGIPSEPGVFRHVTKSILREVSLVPEDQSLDSAGSPLRVLAREQDGTVYVTGIVHALTKPDMDQMTFDPAGLDIEAFLRSGFLTRAFGRGPENICGYPVSLEKTPSGDLVGTFRLIPSEAGKRVAALLGVHFVLENLRPARTFQEEPG